jgi:hypothetical protein
MMSTEGGSGKESNQTAGLVSRPQQVLFAESAPGTTFGVVSGAEPSSLALLAAGVAGMAARRARRSQRLKLLQTKKTDT